MKSLARVPLVLSLLWALPALATAQNTNDNAPVATNVLAFDSDTKITVSYASFTTAGNNWLRGLYAKGEAGAQARKGYNERYIPGRLAGKLELSKDVELAGNPLAAGAYKFTFKIDEDLVWNLVVMNDKGDEICSIAMNTERDDKRPASRLTITPIAAAEGKAGSLDVRFGPLHADVAFKVGATPAAKKAEAPAASKK
jgi:hypothetical protein